MIEKDIENELNNCAERIDALCFKFVPSQVSGIPDRIFIYKGKVIFIELKAPGKKPRILQEKMIKLLQKHGADVRVIATLEQIKAFEAELLEKIPLME